MVLYIPGTRCRLPAKKNASQVSPTSSLSQLLPTSIRAPLRESEHCLVTRG